MANGKYSQKASMYTSIYTRNNRDKQFSNRSRSRYTSNFPPECLSHLISTFLPPFFYVRFATFFSHSHHEKPMPLLTELKCAPPRKKHEMNGFGVHVCTIFVGSFYIIHAFLSEEIKNIRFLCFKPFHIQREIAHRKICVGCPPLIHSNINKAN
jgi:hypothetical protein